MERIRELVARRQRFISAVLKRVKLRRLSGGSETGLMADELRSSYEVAKEAGANLAIYR
jgi:hypothetical protein